MVFCQILTESTERLYTLPSEAQWEYACRAGTETPFHMGETISSSQANYNANFTYADGAIGLYRGETVPVGGFDPNPFGLYNMHGNVREWCRDWYDGQYYGLPPRPDPVNTENTGHSQWVTLRGGSWYLPPSLCRSALRHRYAVEESHNDFGFRVVRNPR